MYCARKVGKINIGRTKAEFVKFKDRAGADAIMAIGAHADDIEIDCAATVIKEIRKGAAAIEVIVSDGCAAGSARVRKMEAIESAGIRGVTELYFLGFPDTRLSECFNRIVQMLGKLIREIVKPKMLLTHSLRDMAPDHATVAKAALLMGRTVPVVLAYRGTPFYSDFSPNYFTEIDQKLLKVKADALLCFKSQNAQDNFGLDYVKANAVYYGRMAGLRYAEGFELVRWVEP